MRSADRYAAIKAIGTFVNEQAAIERDQVRQAMDDTGANSFVTPFGKVYDRVNSDGIVFDEDRLLEYAEAADVDAVETTKVVRDTFRKLFMIDGDQVIFTPTGEVIDFAKIIKGGHVVVARLTDDAKQRAAELLAGDQLIRMITTGEES